MSERNTYWENQIKAFKQFQREIEGSTSSTAHTTYWLTGWDMGVKENQKKIADLEDDLNAAIDEVKVKDKRIAELEKMIVRLHNIHPSAIKKNLDWWIDMFKILPPDRFRSEGSAE